MRSTSIPEVPIELDRDSHLALPQQLASAVRQRIDRGELLPGDELPSTRAWAAQLGVSRGTVVAAYEQLTGEGYLTGERGSATRINPRLPQTHPSAASADDAGGTAPLSKIGHAPSTNRTHESGTAHSDTRRAAPDSRTNSGIGALTSGGARPGVRPIQIVDMLPGRPATDWLRTPAWRRAWRIAADTEPTQIPPEGDARFRVGISEHYRRMRGLARTPDQYLVTAGGREGLTLIVNTLAAEIGHSRPIRVGVESPGYPSLRRTVRRLGCQLVALDVDHAGLQTDRLPLGEPQLDLVIVTPSHQYPIGGSLPIERRLELLAWAKTTNTLIVEDDYDSELRYVGQPLPTLAALDDARDGSVALLGTFSTTVAPSLGIGTLCVPNQLRERLLDTRRDLGTPVSALVQHAFAEYLESGELHRHTARMRRTYRQGRGLVLEKIGALPNTTVSPMDGGLHAVVHSTRTEEAILAACEDAGVKVAPGAEYWQGDSQPSAATGGSIVIGYAHLSADALEEGLFRLRQALTA